MGAVRVAVAAGCLAAQWVGSGGSLAAKAGLSFYLAYAFGAILMGRSRGSRWPLLDVAADALALLASCGNAAAAGQWASALLFVHLLTAAAMCHRWPVAAAAGAVAAAFLLVVGQPAAAPLYPLVLLGTPLAATLAWQKNILEDRFRGASRQALYYRAEAEQAREAERQRIAADFHDGPLQSCISLLLRLEVLRKALLRDPEDGRRELAQLQDLWGTQLAELRSFVRNMRPQEMDGAGLGISVRKLAEHFDKDSGITVHLRDDGRLGRPDSDTSMGILQLLREALHNVQKHSKASRVSVTLEKPDASLHLTVEDNGQGFDFAGSFTLEELEVLGLGPASIKRRVRALGGELWVDSRPGMGAGLRIRIPA